ncbi:MAG: DsbA family protein [Actinomycetota bacterium]|nr:DsbA family protein [Actinomycetota bacterium]
MSTTPEPRNDERKAQARAARESAEAGADAKAARSHRIVRLLAVLAAAAAIVVIAIVASSSGGSKDSASGRTSAAKSTGGSLPGQKDATAQFAGVPQKGIYLGRSDAPLRAVSFVDMQCPYCREFGLKVLPTLVRKYVRTGKLRMELRTLSFLGPDSVTAGRAVAAAAEQDKAWPFADLLYVNQGEENGGWVTPALIDKAYKAAGVDAAKANAFAKAPGSQSALGAANSLAGQLAVDSTPTILVGKRGGGVAKVDVDPADTAGYTKAIDALLGSAGA